MYDKTEGSTRSSLSAASSQNGWRSRQAMVPRAAGSPGRGRLCHSDNPLLTFHSWSSMQSVRRGVRTAGSPVARRALQHPTDEGEGLGLRHRAGGHGAVVARVELPPPPAQCHGRRARGHFPAALFLRFSMHIGIKIEAAALGILCAVDRPAGIIMAPVRPRRPPPALQDVVVPLVVGRAREGVDAAAQQDCPGPTPTEKSC